LLVDVRVRYITLEIDSYELYFPSGRVQLRAQIRCKVSILFLTFVSEITSAAATYLVEGRTRRDWVKLIP
jgi:hypothetical protein